MRKIQLFVPSYHVEECLSEIRECLERGWTGVGFKTTQMEGAWVDYTGLPHAHFLNSATAGLHLAVRIFKEEEGWEDGDEIITTPLTFVSTNHAILYERLRPVFADTDRHLCLDPESVRARITPRTRAVMFVGVGGNAGQYRAMVELCRAHGLRLILDAAHMAGTTLDGRIPGGDADAVVYSFQAVKNLSTGDSGMVCFADAAHDRKARTLSWMGIDKDTGLRMGETGAYQWKYDVRDVGFKYNGNSIAAAIGLVQLKYLDQDNAYRRELAAVYDDALSDAGWVGRVPVAAGCVSARHLYQILVEDRDAMIGRLNAAGIFPGVHYRDNTDYALYQDAAGSCPNAAAQSARLLSLPLHLRLTHGDARYVAETVVRCAG